MCTVTWVRGSDGYELFCNRDEQRTRAEHQEVLAGTIRAQEDVASGELRSDGLEAVARIAREQQRAARGQQNLAAAERRHGKRVDAARNGQLRPGPRWRTR